MAKLNNKRKNKNVSLAAPIATEVVDSPRKKIKRNSITNDSDESECPPSPASPPNPCNTLCRPDDDSPKEDEPKDYRKLTLKYARKSLEHYNKEKGTNYVLVEALVSSALFKPAGTAVHCNFEAKPTNQNGGSSTKLFFGELLYDSCTTNLEVTYCDILEGKFDCCKECGDFGGMKHPPSGFLLPSYASIASEVVDTSLEKTKRYSIMNDSDELECPPSPVWPPNPYNTLYCPDEDSPKEAEPENYRKLTLKYARKSLEHYNKEKGTNYVLVEALVSSAMFKPDGTAVHCNFEAKPTNQNGGSSTKPFFGELLYDSCTTNLEVTYCDIIKGKSHRCKECGDFGGMKHPPSGFLLPNYGDVPFTVRTRSKG